MRRKFLSSIIAGAIILNGTTVFANENVIENLGDTEVKVTENAQKQEDSKLDKKENEESKQEVIEVQVEEENKEKKIEEKTSQVDEKVNNEQKKETTDKKDVSKENKISEYQREQLNYAIEEMKIAINLLDNADLLNVENLNRMTIFGSTSVDRVRGLNIKPDQEEYVHVQWIENSLVELHDVSYRVNRVSHAIKNVEIVFSADRNDTIDNMKNVINTLNEVLTQEMNSGILNNATLRTGVDILHQYASQIPEHPILPPGEYPIPPTEDENTGNENYDNLLEQLTYAVEEMRIAVDLLDNADLLDVENLNRMTIFGSTAVERVRGLEISKDHEWYVHVQWIENSLGRLNDMYYRVNRLSHAINNVEIVFSEDRNDTVENKLNVLKTLYEVIKQEAEAGYVNNPTLKTAWDILNKYYHLLPVGDGSEDDNMEVEPPVGDGSGDDNMEVEPPVGDGSGDDNMEVEPPVGDGSGDDNMEVEPPVGDGSGDDNMEVEPPVGDGSGDDNMEVEPPVGDGSANDNMGVNPGNNNNNSGNSNNNTSKLPQTGTATSIFQLGVISTLLGAVLKFKK